MTNLSLINQMLSELVICPKGVFCRGQVEEEEQKERGKGGGQKYFQTQILRNYYKSKRKSFDTKNFRACPNYRLGVLVADFPIVFYCLIYDI